MKVEVGRLTSLFCRIFLDKAIACSGADIRRVAEKVIDFCLLLSLRYEILSQLGFLR